jgi:hypothetical protein
MRTHATLAEGQLDQKRHKETKTKKEKEKEKEKEK